MHKVSCCGGRNFADYKLVTNRLDQLIEVLGDFAVIHGGAKGADDLCGLWAKSKGLQVIVVPANWHIHGNGAGPVRNKWMIDLCSPTYGVAFPGGNGTSDMVRKLKAYGATVWEIQQ